MAHYQIRLVLIISLEHKSSTGISRCTSSSVLAWWVTNSGKCSLRTRRGNYHFGRIIHAQWIDLLKFQSGLITLKSVFKSYWSMSLVDYWKHSLNVSSIALVIDFKSIKSQSKSNFRKQNFDWWRLIALKSVFKFNWLMGLVDYWKYSMNLWSNSSVIDFKSIKSQSKSNFSKQNFDLYC